VFNPTLSTLPRKPWAFEPLAPLVPSFPAQPINWSLPVRGGK